MKQDKYGHYKTLETLVSYPSLKLAWAQIAEGKNNDQELLQC